MRRIAILAVALAAGLGVAACGDDPEPTGATALRVEVRPGGDDGAAPVMATLRCDPPAGDLADPAAACAALDREEVRTALEPVPPDTACTEIWGGPETARITGTLDGLELDVALSRANGCEIARWDALAPVLPAYQAMGTAG